MYTCMLNYYKIQLLMPGRRRRSSPNTKEVQFSTPEVASNFILGHADIEPGTLDLDSLSIYPSNLAYAAKNKGLEALNRIVNTIGEIMAYVPQKERFIFQSHLSWLNIFHSRQAQTKAIKDSFHLFHQGTKQIGEYLFSSEYSFFGRQKPITVTDSHRNDANLITTQLLRENCDPNKIGVIVLDRHADLTSAGGIIDTEFRACAVTSLAQKGFGNVAIVGFETSHNEDYVQASETRLKSLEEQLMKIAITGSYIGNFTELLAIYSDYLLDEEQGKLNSAPFVWFNDPVFRALHYKYQNVLLTLKHDLTFIPRNQIINTDQVAHSIFKKFKEKGIGAFVMSIDIDFLDLWHHSITGTLYSPYASLGILGNFDNKKLIRILQDIQNEKDPLARQTLAAGSILDISNALEGYYKPNILRDKYYEFLLYMSTRLIPNLKDAAMPFATTAGFQGIEMQRAIQLLTSFRQIAPEYGISFGVERKNGTKFLGTVTEVAFSHPDLNGNTTRAVASLIKALVE